MISQQRTLLPVFPYHVTKYFSQNVNEHPKFHPWWFWNWRVFPHLRIASESNGSAFAPKWSENKPNRHPDRPPFTPYPLLPPASASLIAVAEGVCDDFADVTTNVMSEYGPSRDGDGKKGAYLSTNEQTKENKHKQRFGEFFWFILLSHISYLLLCCIIAAERTSRGQGSRSNWSRKFFFCIQCQRCNNHEMGVSWKCSRTENRVKNQPLLITLEFEAVRREYPQFFYFFNFFYLFIFFESWDFSKVYFGKKNRLFCTFSAFRTVHAQIFGEIDKKVEFCRCVEESRASLKIIAHFFDIFST